MKKTKRGDKQKTYSPLILKEAQDFFKKYDIFYKTVDFYYQQFYYLYIDENIYTVSEICTKLSYDERTFYRHYKKIKTFLEELKETRIIPKKRAKNTDKRCQ